MHQELVPDPFLILVNNPKQSLHTRNSFKNKIYEVFCPFESGQFGKERKKLQTKKSENEKCFLDQLKKTFFIVFEELSFF